MIGPFHEVQHLGHIVEVDARADRPEIARLDDKRRARTRRSHGRQTAAERLVDDLAKRAAAPTRLGLELGCHIVIQGERGPHIVMLSDRHHDVTRWAAPESEG